MDVSFIAALGEVFENLPEHPIAFFGVVSVLLSVVAIIFFRQAHHVVQLFAFILLFVGGGGVTYAALSFGEPIPIEPPPNVPTLDSTSSRDLGTPFSFIPEQENILVFDATKEKEVGLKLARCFQRVDDSLSVDYLKNWVNEWEMAHTRIYYQGDIHEQYARKIARKIPGIQYVINYNDQEPYADDDMIWPDAPPDAFRYMGGMGQQRNLIVFVGADTAEWLANSDENECLVNL